MKKTKIAPDDIPGLLATLRTRDSAAQQSVLRQLCPCRSRCYDGEAWLMILHTYYTSFNGAVRHQAEHAIDTLRERAATNDEARELIRWLATEHSMTLPDKEPERKELRRSTRSVTSRDVPRLMDALRGDDSQAQAAALNDLCPCRNRVYHKEVWLEIFRLHDESEASNVRDRAQHAINTLLRERTRVDPRSRELVRWLRGRVRLPGGYEPVHPAWHRASLAAATIAPPLQIPAWERGHRSKSNRRR